MIPFKHSALLRLLPFLTWLPLATSLAAQAQDSGETARPLRIYTVGDTRDGLVRRFPALIEANRSATLAFRVAGTLTKLEVKAGNKVTSGQLLAELDRRDYSLNVDQARAAFDLAKAQYQRGQSLIGRNLIAQSDLDSYRAQFEAAQADLGLAEDNLRYTRLTAPYGGTVSSTQVNNHEAVSAGQPIVELSDLDAVDVAFNVPGSLMSQIDSETDPVTISGEVYFSGDQSRHYRAHYKEHDSQADPQTSSYRVVFTLPRPGDRIVLPGMEAEIVIDMSAYLSAGQALIIPVSAVFHDNASGTSQVWVVTAENRLERRELTLDGVQREGVTVVSGLHPGERIVQSATDSLQQGMAVRELVRERGL